MEFRNSGEFWFLEDYEECCSSAGEVLFGGDNRIRGSPVRWDIAHTYLWLNPCACRCFRHLQTPVFQYWPLPESMRLNLARPIAVLNSSTGRFD